MSGRITTCACGEPAYDGRTQCTLCQADEGLFASLAAAALPDVPYSGLEERFFKGLNTITRRAVLQVLGGYTDALMAEVRTHSDERRLFKHLFKVAPAAPVAQEPVNATLAGYLIAEINSGRFGERITPQLEAVIEQALRKAKPLYHAASAQPVTVPRGHVCCKRCHATKQEGKDACPECGGKDFAVWTEYVKTWGATSAAQGDAKASATCEKFGYILQAADGSQAWLKGDPAAGMERYGKIIQMYKKGGE